MYGFGKSGRRCWAGVVLLGVGLSVASSSAQVQSLDDSIQTVLQRAGNTDSDEVRLSCLEELRKQLGLNESLRDDLGKLIAQIERWLGDKRLDYFGREAGRKKDFDFKIGEDSPVHPLTWLYRGRMVIW